jgi:hypothetical protein
MEESQKSEVSAVKEQFGCVAQLSLLDTKKVMRIESAEQDKYISVLGHLFDESIKYNDMKQVQ